MPRSRLFRRALRVAACLAAFALPFTAISLAHQGHAPAVRAADLGPVIARPPDRPSRSFDRFEEPQAPTTSTTAPRPLPPPAPASRPHASQEAYRAAVRPLPSDWPGLPPRLRAIGGCESNGSPSAPLAWTKPNRWGSTASGAFQDLDSTWQTWEARWGTGRYSRAMYAPPDEQVRVNFAAFQDGGGRGEPWAASRACWAGY